MNLWPFPSSAWTEAGFVSLSVTTGLSYVQRMPHSKRASAKFLRPRFLMLMPQSDTSEYPTVRSPST